jgi:hypothetical protein
VSQSYAAEQQELKKAFLQAAEQALDGQEGEDAAAKGLIKKRKVAGAAGDGEEAAGGAGKEQQVNQVSVHPKFMSVSVLMRQASVMCMCMSRCCLVLTDQQAALTAVEPGRHQYDSLDLKPFRSLHQLPTTQSPTAPA